MNAHETHIESKIRVWLSKVAEAEELAATADQMKVEIEEMFATSISAGTVSERIDVDNGMYKASLYMTSKGTYDWESIGKALEPDDDQIEKFTTIAWNKLSQAIAAPARLEQLKQMFYRPGKQYAQLAKRQK